MKHILIWLIRLYQKHLSPLKKRSCCRFYPTCSSYAVEALQKRGFFVGSLLMILRIFRCQPLCPGGWDPVPERGLRNPKFKEIPLTKYYYPEEYGLERDNSDKRDTQ